MKDWTKTKKAWVQAIVNLFEQMFGNDFLTYIYDKEHGTKVDDKVVACILEYSHDHWESLYNGSSKSQVEVVHFCSPKLNPVDTPEQVQTLHDLTNKCPALTEGNFPSGLDLGSRDLSVRAQPRKVKNSSCGSANELIKTVSIEDEENLETLQQSTLQTAMSKAKTRAEIADLHKNIPSVAPSLPSGVKVVYGKFSRSNPYCLTQRPCESDIEKAEKMLLAARRAGKNPIGFEFQGIGLFFENDLSILKRFCKISDTFYKVSSEANWLSSMRFPPEELEAVESALWNCPSNRPVLKYGTKVLDATSFSDLVEERYIDSFVIDICISKFLDEASASHAYVNTVYFPSEFHDWMSSNDKKFQQLRLIEQLVNAHDLQQILIPVYMPSHWGLIFIDVANHIMYFDDGLTSQVPTNTLPFVKSALELLSEMYPHHGALQTRFWRNSNRFERFGMPSQVPVNSTHIGTGSCGVGVIMAAKDIIDKGPLAINNFRWRYCEMDLYRKHLMLQILSWSALD